MVLLDLQKAFDTVDHTILLNKLKWLGTDDLTVQWFRSYLTGRTQVTDIGGTMSEPKLWCHLWSTARFDTWSSFILVICK